MGTTAGPRSTCIRPCRGIPRRAGRGGVASRLGGGRARAPPDACRGRDGGPAAGSERAELPPRRAARGCGREGQGEVAAAPPPRAGGRAARLRAAPVAPCRRSRAARYIRGGGCSALTHTGPCPRLPVLGGGRASTAWPAAGRNGRWSPPLPPADPPLPSPPAPAAAAANLPRRAACEGTARRGGSAAPAAPAVAPAARGARPPPAGMRRCHRGRRDTVWSRGRRGCA